MNSYAKAVFATLSALVANIQVQMPTGTSEWIKAVAYALGVGIVTWYVPNTSKDGKVIPPTPKAPNA